MRRPRPAALAVNVVAALVAVAATLPVAAGAATSVSYTANATNPAFYFGPSLSCETSTINGIVNYGGSGSTTSVAFNKCTVLGSTSMPVTITATTQWKTISGATTWNIYNVNMHVVYGFGGPCAFDIVGGANAKVASPTQLSFEGREESLAIKNVVGAGCGGPLQLKPRGYLYGIYTLNQPLPAGY